MPSAATSPLSSLAVVVSEPAGALVLSVVVVVSAGVWGSQEGDREQGEGPGLGVEHAWGASRRYGGIFTRGLHGFRYRPTCQT